MMPTFADLVDVEMPTETDGVSFLPTLLKEENQVEHEYLYWEFHLKGGRQAVRKGNWKAVIYNIKKDSTNIELYDLITDVKEQNNVAKNHPEVVAELSQIMKEAHVDSELFPLIK